MSSTANGTTSCDLGTVDQVVLISLLREQRRERFRRLRRFALLASKTHANSTYNSTRRKTMSKTPTEELEVVTMRLPSPLLDRARKDSEERGRPYAHSVRAALEEYFRSLLDARYRQLIAKQALAEAKKGSPVTKKQR